MHVTGRYKLLNLTFGLLPFIGASFIYRLQEDSGFWVSWFSIVRRSVYPSNLLGFFVFGALTNICSVQIPLGFGNAVVLQTMLSACLSLASSSHA